MTDITVPADQARAIAGILRRLPDAQEGTIAAAVLRHHANTLDPPRLQSLRDEAIAALGPYTYGDLGATLVDAVLAVVRRHVLALPRVHASGNGDTWRCDDVLGLLGVTDD